MPPPPWFSVRPSRCLASAWQCYGKAKGSRSRHPERAPRCRFPTRRRQCVQEKTFEGQGLSARTTSLSRGFRGTCRIFDVQADFISLFCSAGLQHQVSTLWWSRKRAVNVSQTPITCSGRAFCRFGHSKLLSQRRNAAIYSICEAKLSHTF